MTGARDSVRQRMKELQSTFTNGLGKTLEHLDRSLGVLTAQSPAPDCRAALASIHELAHAMAGSSATFGYEALGTAAHDLELLGARELNGESTVSPAALPEIIRLVGEIKSAAEAGPETVFE